MAGLEYIASQALTSTSTSVSFTSIPQTYSDLMLQYTMRNTATGTTASQDLRLYFDSTSTVYSYVRMTSTGTSLTGSNNQTQDGHYPNLFPGSTALTNLFGTGEIYIPYYTKTANRQIVSSVGSEGTTAGAASVAQFSVLYRNTNAITSITLIPTIGSFAIGCSFYLYGI